MKHSVILAGTPVVRFRSYSIITKKVPFVNYRLWKWLSDIISAMPFYTYILKCSDGTLYCGYTNDLPARIIDHNNSSKGAKYTKSRRPVKLVYSEAFESKVHAQQRERQIKRMSRIQKQLLANLL